MNKGKMPTSYVLALATALQEKGVEVELEHPDGFKHVDIAIIPARIYIEVDGTQHLTDPDQIIRDFSRDIYSNIDGYQTLHIPNEMLKIHLNRIVDAIVKVVKQRTVAAPKNIVYEK